MRKLIYQVKVGPNPPAFYDTCIKSVAQYCKKYGIDHIVETEAKLKIVPLNSYRSESALKLSFLPIFEKEVAFEYLDQYDQIAIIDADIFIRDNAPNIFDSLEPDTAFAGVLECDLPLTKDYIRKIHNYSLGQYQTLIDVPKWNIRPDTGFEFFNMGLMVFTKEIIPYLNGETPLQFIRRPEFERFVNGEGNWKWSTDQTLLNYWVRKSGMKLQNLDWRWNTLFKGVEDAQLPKSYFLHFFLSNNLPQKGAEIPSIVADLAKASKIKGHK